VGGVLVARLPDAVRARPQLVRVGRLHDHAPLAVAHALEQRRQAQAEDDRDDDLAELALGHDVGEIHLEFIIGHQIN